MTIQRMMEWLALAATAGLSILMKWLHLGVTNYNVFLLILLGWCLVLIFVFRGLTISQQSTGGG
jgi:hypothetical protein